MTKITPAPFKLVSDMNVAFGNPKGDPLNINGKRLLNQCKNIGSEFIELMAAFGQTVSVTFTGGVTPVPVEAGAVDPVVDIRDALCDIMVFALGAYHFMGYDADEDMETVVKALYTRFCRDPEHLAATIKFYADKGIATYHEGKFPTVAIKSAEDQMMPEYPKGKFLKAVGYQKPVFKMTAPQRDVVDEMAEQRKKRAAWEAQKRQEIDKHVMAVRQQLELLAFGMPPFDENKNQCGPGDQEAMTRIHNGVHTSGFIQTVETPSPSELHDAATSALAGSRWAKLT